MIVLIGFMGAGKTSVGRELASLVGLPFIDTDTSISERTGHTIAEIFSNDGERAFRAIEREVIAEVLDGPEAVVSLGGGALEDTGTRDALTSANVVYLETDVSQALERIEASSRPMLARHDPATLFQHRKPFYEAAADLIVRTDHRTVEQIAHEIADRVMGGPSPVDGERIHVELGTRSYDIYVGAGVIGDVPALVGAGVEKVFVVTHPHLRALATGLVSGLLERGGSPVVLEVPDGEHSKSWDVAGGLLAAIAAAEGHRGDAVIGFGGGVITDLAGFVASTYARGVDVIHVPTSLLAQVDAAVGGKTGVNLPLGKNLAGTFHQPRAVICDVELLAGLPDAEFTSGLAEVIKAGLIGDGSILDRIQDNREALDQRDHSLLIPLISAAVRVKADIVSADETDRGVRNHLNYGHTFAHAIEAAEGFGNIRHGEAVALGMMAAAHLARALGRIDESTVDVHRRSLEAVGLPVTAELTYEMLEPAWKRDKKYDKSVRFVLLSSLGEPEPGIEVERSLIERALERMRP